MIVSLICLVLDNTILLYILQALFLGTHFHNSGGGKGGGIGKADFCKDYIFLSQFV